MAFKKWLKAQIKKKRWGDSPEGDFAKDAVEDKKLTAQHLVTWEAFEDYLISRRAPRYVLGIALPIYKAWVAEDPKARVDGMSRRDIAAFRKATRQVWSWSTPKKICLQRALLPDGFSVCEECFAVVAKVYVDHIRPVGDLDAGYFERLMVPSSGLQALCKKCHDAKTREERKAAK